MAAILINLIIGTPLLHTFMGMPQITISCMYVCIYIGSLPIEFDVLMKYYNHLTELLWNEFDYSIFVKAEIITEKDKDFIVLDKWGEEFLIVLIKILNNLLNGDTNLFYKLLENLQYIPNGDKMTLRMQADIKLFTGMYTYTVYMHEYSVL